ncbi:MAG TPA: cbb3-type cytochrome oxidase assembly protein CcoS [Luteimonas sp.]|nr:cbb3-type cytochrome oxidase assembly protein CcoS [Luteimonas sp.]
MAILLFLIPISLLLLGVAVWAFVWSVRDGQFDDLDAAPLDILREDRPAPRPQGGAGEDAPGGAHPVGPAGPAPAPRDAD